MRDLHVSRTSQVGAEPLRAIVDATNPLVIVAAFIIVSLLNLFLNFTLPVLNL